VSAFCILNSAFRLLAFQQPASPADRAGVSPCKRLTRVASCRRGIDGGYPAAVALLNDIQIATDNRPPDTSGLVTPA
jgi:hypothetical protein